MTNPYAEIKQTFKFLEFATGQEKAWSGYPGLPSRLRGRPYRAALHDYLFGLMLVCIVAQLEQDIKGLRSVPGLHSAPKLARRLEILRDHFHIGRELYEAVDRIRDARNRFVHENAPSVDARCTMAEVPGRLVDFLHHCRPPSYA